MNRIESNVALELPEVGDIIRGNEFYMVFKDTEGMKGLINLRTGSLLEHRYASIYKLVSKLSFKFTIVQQVVIETE